MIHTMMITFVQLAAGLAKVCGMGLLAINAKELVAIQNSTGMTIMSKQIDALKLAFEALKENQHLVADNERHAYVMEYNSIIEKCEEALAKTEQEPVAWEQFYPDIGKPQLKQLPQLSQEVVLQYPKEAVDWQKQQKEYAQQLFKETEQEPVAWYHAEDYKTHFTTNPSPDLIGKYWKPLYTTPPQPKEPKQEQGEPVAVVTGVYGGRFIVEPTNSSMVLPVNMALYAHPQRQRVVFPTMIRRMWSGADVQAWLDENVNKE